MRPCGDVDGYAPGSPHPKSSAMIQAMPCGAAAAAKPVTALSEESMGGEDSTQSRGAVNVSREARLDSRDALAVMTLDESWHRACRSQCEQPED